ncbi:MAG: SUMF1/EgtB/PvdO family nonheme iron enzyme [Anaerolineae bacterium]|nr:SUMF1/EgtB/PvdO family nonheme iron enzyme [Anaerolineae bacterium]
MSHIFISYSKNDIAFARHLRRLLEAEGFSVWMDETRLVPAERWWPTIEANIRSCAAFIVIMSGHSKQSVWVEREVLVAEEEDVKKPIFPILLAGKRWARLAEKQYEDMTGGVNAALSPRLIGGLAQYAPRTREPAPPPLPGPLLETGQQPIAEPATTSQTGRRVPALVWGVALAAVIGLVGLFALNGRFGGGSGETPTSPATTTSQVVAQVPTNAPTLTATDTPVPPIATNTPAPSFTPTPTLSRADEAATVTAFIPVIETDEAATLIRAVELTAEAATAVARATANAQTPTPTPDYRLIAETQIANERVATQAVLGVTANEQWRSVEYAFEDVVMVLVPVGCFDMGSKDGNDDEQPVHQQCFDMPFWIDKYEVTNAQFLRFGGQAGRGSYWTGDSRPRERITWFEARDFCAMRNARLPTESEWEYAARGPDNMIYPWGNTFGPDSVVYEDNSGNQTANVGSRPQGAAWIGALDMSGNVWEWVSSLYEPYPYDSTDGRERDTGNITDVRRVLRGGSWNLGRAMTLHASRRSWFGPDSTYLNLGFRCAREYQDGDLGNRQGS